MRGASLEGPFSKRSLREEKARCFHIARGTKAVVVVLWVGQLQARADRRRSCFTVLLVPRRCAFVRLQNGKGHRHYPGGECNNRDDFD